MRMMFIVLIGLVAGSCSKPHARAEAEVHLAPLTPPLRAYHLHLPGIGGKMRIDRYMVQGLRDSELDADIEVYDWTAGDPGIDALLAYERNREQAKHVAKMIGEKFREDPRRRITVTGHSGGAGLAAWALEKLPDDVQIDSLVLLAPALSPKYDLTSALRHVRGKVYVFTSPLDIAVLGIGTKVFGTIDGVHTEAAGKVGFIRPNGADEAQYAKIVPLPYRREWMRFGNIGDHIGPMKTAFAREVLGPVLQSGELPATMPTTNPAEVRRD